MIKLLKILSILLLILEIQMKSDIKQICKHQFSQKDNYRKMMIIIKDLNHPSVKIIKSQENFEFLIFKWTLNKIISRYLEIL